MSTSGSVGAGVVNSGREPGRWPMGGWAPSPRGWGGRLCRRRISGGKAARASGPQRLGPTQVAAPAPWAPPSLAVPRRRHGGRQAQSACGVVLSIMAAGRRPRPPTIQARIPRRRHRQVTRGCRVGAVAKSSECAASAGPSKSSEGAVSVGPATSSEGAVSAGARGRGAPPPSDRRGSARRPRPVSRSAMGRGIPLAGYYVGDLSGQRGEAGWGQRGGGAPRAELAAAASPIPTPYQGWGG